jgi:hypothetical protein
VVDYLHAKPLLPAIGKMLHIPGDVIATTGGVIVVTFYLLQEDGVSRIILEDGSGLLVLEH